MALNDLWKKFIRDDEVVDGDDAAYYRPRQKTGAPTLVDEPDDDTFRTPKMRTAATRMPTANNDYDALLDDEDDTYAAPASKPRFKRVIATDLKSAEHVIDLVCSKFIVLVNTEDMADSKLVPFRCYIAGAVQALGAHITPLDDENVFISIEPFDATPYLPAQDETAEQADDLI
jgi:hypothetical protein